MHGITFKLVVIRGWGGFFFVLILSWVIFFSSRVVPVLICIYYLSRLAG